MDERSKVRDHVAIALASCAVLLFEVLVTRVLSVVLWYHFVFLSVSLAMLGLGAPGVWFAMAKPGPRTLPRALLAAAALVPLSVLAIVRLGAAFKTATTFWVVVLLAPALALGTAVCALLLSARGRSIGTMYGADLLGATIGALLVFPLLYGLPTPQVVALVGLLPLVAVLLVDRASRVPAFVIGGLTILTVASGAPYRLRYTKVYAESVQPLFEKWTPTARLAVFPSAFVLRDDGAAFGWGMGAKWVQAPHEQLWLEQDGSAGTPITKWDGTSPLPHLMFDVTSAAYQIRRPETVAIVGAGGGRDILTALKSGATRVDAIELNPFTIEAIGTTFAAYSGDPYHRAGVRAIASEGRSYLASTQTAYDVLQISLIDTWAATSAGAYTLSENNLYTLEAFRSYLRRLAPGGVLTVSRWAGGSHQLEIARLALLAKAALIAEHSPDPNGSMVLLEAGKVGNLLVFKEPVGDRLDDVDAVARERGFSRRWPMPKGAVPSRMVQEVLVSGDAKFHREGLDLSPPTDDRPFFFQTLRLFDLPKGPMLAQVSENEQAVVQLRRLLTVVAVVTVALFFVPFGMRGRFPRAPGFIPGTAYFAAIGLGFMFVELPLMQRCTHWLGHPSRATAVVLATMLLGAGTGAMLAARLSPKRVRRVALALPLVVLLFAVVLPFAARATLGQPLEVRIAVVVLSVFPAAVAMGFAFPVGMMLFGEENRAWFWAVNGAISVLASVSTLALSMTFGFSRVMLGAIVCYAIAALLVVTRPVEEV